MKKSIMITIVVLLTGIMSGQTGNKIQIIDSLLCESYKTNEPGIAVLIARGNNILLRKGYGLSNAELKIPMKPEYVFKVASITKPITAMAVFALLDEKKIQLTDKVCKYIPSLKSEYGNIEIRHLLSHTSGMPNYTHIKEYEAFFNSDYFSYVNEEVSGDTIISIINKYKLEFNPGDEFKYCNTGYFMLERIIEKVTGKTYADYLKQKIFEPLKMKDTRFFSVTDIINNRLSGYTYYDDKIINNPHTFSEGVITKGDGGMISCVDDLFLFYKATMNDKYFNKISFSYYRSLYKLNDSSDSYYSMGFFVRKLKGAEMWNHNGDGSGFASSMLILPEEKIFIVILGNNDLYSKGSSRYHENITKRAAAILMNKPFPSFNTIALTEKNAEKFKGTFKSKDGQIRKIIYEKDFLYLQSENGRKIKLNQFARDRFFYDGYLIELKFNRDKKKNITGFTIINEEGTVTEAKKEAE